MSFISIKNKSPLIIALIFALLLMGLYYGWSFWQGNRPMVFYGRLVDEDGKGLVHTRLKVWTYSWELFQLPPLFLFQNRDMAHAELVAETDKEGYFTISLRMGDSLEIASLTEDKKYARTAGSPTLGYHYSPAKAPPHLIHHPDPNDPVVFTMREYHGPR